MTFHFWKRFGAVLTLHLLALLMTQADLSAQTEQITLIHAIQGAGQQVTDPGRLVTIEGIVTGDYQAPDQLLGFFVQEEESDWDANPETSEGIFVFCAGCPVAVSEGDLVRVTGTAGDYFNLSQIDVPQTDAGEIIVLSSENQLPPPIDLDLPAPGPTSDPTTFEHVEGMLVRFVDRLTVTEFFQMARYGQIVLSEGGKLRQYTNDNRPDAAGLAAYQAEIAARRIILDDLNNVQNGNLPVFHPQPGGFSTTNLVRGGDTIENLVGIMDYAWAGENGTDAWRIRPTTGFPIRFESAQPRTENPADTAGDISVVSFNVLNYFTTIDRTRGRESGDCGPSQTLDCRGPDSEAELARQTAKLTAALQAIDGDVIGLAEIENNPSASLAGIVDALNTALGAEIYDYVNTGTIGNDAIKVGFIYKTTTVGLVGDFAVNESDSFVDPNNTGRPRNRPVLAQTFEVIDPNNPSVGERFTAAVNHLKSKGSSCGTGDDDLLTGQANCNLTRTLGGERLVDWLATDPTGSGDPDFIILGDINAYAQEDPVIAIQNGPDRLAGTDDDYVNLLLEFIGPDAYSYVFDGQWGYLDHALANLPLTAQVSGVTTWHINSDEVNLLDYNDGILDQGEIDWEAKPNQGVGLFAPDPYRTSDHDPVIIGLQLDEDSEPTDPGEPGNPPGGGSGGGPIGSGPIIAIMGQPLNVDEGESEKEMTVTLSESSDQPVTVRLRSQDGSAGANSDYAQVDQLITFAPGQLEKSVTLTPLPDTLYERDEYFELSLSGPIGGQLGPQSNATVVIVEDDPPPTVTIQDVFGSEPAEGMQALNFEVWLSQATAVDLTIQFRTEDGNALAGEDYIATAGRLVIPAGERVGTISVMVYHDEAAEGGEHFTLRLTGMSDGYLDPDDPEEGTLSAVGTILTSPFEPRFYIPFVRFDFLR